MRALEGLQPERVFYYFEEISKIPRGSYHEKAISDYLVEYAKGHGIIYYQDELYNVVMQVPASAGREDEEPVILQGHMDMVCEVRPGVDKDMEKEGLELYVEGDYVHAKDTTLGGDDGIAVAYMLAIADDESISHPPLEFIITVSEEVGMEGANGINLSMLKGHKMINVDSEDEGVFTMSCAGGVSAHVSIPISTVFAPDNTKWYELSVSGLVGGHSGCEIDKGRANANKILGRALAELLTEVEFCIANVCGGKKDNAIPIQAQAVIGFWNMAGNEGLPDDEKAKKIVEELADVLRNEYIKSDDNISIMLNKIDDIDSVDSLLSTDEKRTVKVPDDVSRDKIITYLMSVPNGIQNMSMSVQGLVETSLNLGILELNEDHLFAQHSVRSSVGTRKEYVVKRLTSLAAALGGSVECKGDYPAWEYREDSKVRDKAVRLYEKMYGREPVVEGIHAGLECGLLAGKISGLDCISIGPDMKDIHTYNERLSISSTKRVYEFLIEFLRA